MRGAPLLLACAAALAAAACGEKTKVRDNPETLSALETCQAALADGKKYIEQLERDKTALALKPSGEEVVLVQIEGDILTVKQGRGPNQRAGGNSADDQKLYAAFVAAVQGSSGALQKCYQSALKKDSALESRPITLTMSVSV